MAAVDKCYTNSYKNYQDFKEWAKGKEFTTPRGCKIKISNYIFDWKEEDFTDYLPIFNSPTYFDNYLYHNCPLSFIQKWLTESYSGEGYCKGSPDEIHCTPKLPECAPCTKVKVIRKGLGNCAPTGDCWTISVDKITDNRNGSCWYNEKFDFWILPNEDDEWDCSHCHSKKSVKSIIRKILKKWKLPVGYRIEITSRYVRDTWILETI